MARIFERRIPAVETNEDIWRAPIHTRWLVIGLLLGTTLSAVLIKFTVNWLS